MAHPARPVISKARQLLWRLLALLSLGAGLVGLFLPVMPTVPFVLLAAWCFSRGSARWEAWLLAHPRCEAVAIEADPGQVVAAGAPVVRLALDGPRDAVFAVPEDRVGAIARGADVEVRAWSDGRTLAGLIQPVIVFLMAGLVGTMAYLMMTAIFQTIGNISK